MDNVINTFEGIRGKVLQQITDIVQTETVYIVCNIYARFSIYVVDGEDAIIEQIQERLVGFVDRVSKIKVNDFIFNDLNHPDFKKPELVDPIKKIYYIDRNSQLTNWSITDRYKNTAPISCFWSFKGGLGRTTALVLTAIHLARKGQKVVLLDFDLEAPGLSSIFAYQEEEIGKIRGVVDYLTDLLALKYDQTNISLTDYYYTINHQDIVGSQGGEILLFPAGLVEGNENLYLTKLSKISSLFTGKDHQFSIDFLFNQINAELSPDNIIVDTRTGLNDLGGLFLSRYANMGFLFFFGNKQNMFGLETLLPELKQHPALKFYLVNSPVPRAPLAEEQRRYYIEKSYDLFSDLFYGEGHTPFIEDKTAPHFPIEIPYNDLAVLLNNSSKIRSLVEESNGDNPYLRLADLVQSDNTKNIKSNTNEYLGNIKNLLEAFKNIVPSSAAAEYEFNSLDSLTSNFFPRKDYKFIFDRTKYLILGEKGAGKTALYAVLNNTKYAKELANYCDANTDDLQVTEWVKGMDINYPPKAVFDEFENSTDKTMRIFWKQFLLKAISQEQIEDRHWPSFIKQDKNELDIDIEISNYNDSLKLENRIITVVYDFLDVAISEVADLRGKLVSALLEVWREIYTRYTNIRSKIFLRKDIYDREVNLTDKVKFQNHIAEIKWDYNQLLNIVWKRLWHSNAIQDTDLDKWIKTIQLTDLGVILGQLPNAGEVENRAILTKLLGEYMGGNNKAFPYNWILYHVSDTKQRIQPRSLLNLFSETANKQLESYQETDSDGTLFTPKYMELANEVVSKRRVDDIREEYPLLKSVFDNLKNHLEQFPVEESQLDKALEKLDLPYETAEAKRRLEEIGVLYEYKFNRKGTEKRYHIPDLYLIGMGLKRKGPGAHKSLFGRK